ncbi:YTH domain-containing protein 1-like [Asparagus officinalis]|uniref:YTH domain-containing protein 1-like n=1 Tax=Asparagus officinalis TaxID=4686 RepID=UPI00098DF184|nr:YTH domain-containing protein 1-like [Asparagus officinalis]
MRENSPGDISADYGDSSSDNENADIGWVEIGSKEEPSEEEEIEENPSEEEEVEEETSEGEEVEEDLDEDEAQEVDSCEEPYEDSCRADEEKLCEQEIDEVPSCEVDPDSFDSLVKTFQHRENPIKRIRVEA